MLPPVPLPPFFQREASLPTNSTRLKRIKGIPRSARNAPLDAPGAILCGVYGKYDIQLVNFPTVGKMLVLFPPFPRPSRLPCPSIRSQQFKGEGLAALTLVSAVGKAVAAV